MSEPLDHRRANECKVRDRSFVATSCDHEGGAGESPRRARSDVGKKAQSCDTMSLTGWKRILRRLRATRALPPRQTFLGAIDTSI